MKFELNCDRVALLPLQDLPNALASFFHLSFVFQMRYCEKVIMMILVLNYKWLCPSECLSHPVLESLKPGH